MAYKIVAFVCLQFALINTINANCVDRFIPGLQRNLIPMPLPAAESLLQNQMIIGPNYNPPIMEVPYGVETLVTNHLPATTIIQDSTVANNLANALQLLVVSNLLSNTLPLSPPEVIVPSLGPVNPVLSPINQFVSPVSPCGFGPYNYIY